MEKKIFLNAYTNVNLGDDLFIKILCDRYRNDVFYIYANRKYKYIFSKCKNLKVYSFGYNLVQYIGKFLHKIGLENFIKDIIQKRIVKKCDAIVVIGGSMFIQKGLTKKRARIKIREDKKLLKYCKPVFLIGSNFGPFDDNSFYFEYKEIFKNYRDICFREQYSYNLFKDINNVRIANDVIFTMEEDFGAKNDNKTVLISIIDFEKKAEEKRCKTNYKNMIVELINLYTKEEYNIILMGFCNAEGDKNAIKEILQDKDIKDKSKIQEYYYDGDIVESLKIINKANQIIATRFHSMILGFLLNKKVFTFVYSKKTLNVLKDLGVNAYIELDKIENETAVEIFNRLNEEEFNLDIKEIKNNANLQFKALDSFIGERNE